MKTTILNQQQTKRRTTLVLGVLTTLFSTFTFGNNIERGEQDQIADLGITNQINYTGDTGTKDLKKQQANLEDETTSVDTIVNYTAEMHREMVQTILENESIIESQEDVNPSIYLNQTVEEVINEGQQVIESNLDNTTYPLDFERINNYDNANKTADFKNRVFQTKSIKS